MPRSFPRSTIFIPMAWFRIPPLCSARLPNARHASDSERQSRSLRFTIRERRPRFLRWRISLAMARFVLGAGSGYLKHEFEGFNLEVPRCANCTSEVWIFGPSRNDASSVHHDLHAIAHLDLGMGVENVQDTKALRRAVDPGHAV